MMWSVPTGVFSVTRAFGCIEESPILHAMSNPLLQKGLDSSMSGNDSMVKSPSSSRGTVGKSPSAHKVPI